MTRPAWIPSVAATARRCALIACGAALLAGCGQKGPLYLPDRNPTVVTRPAPTGASQSQSSSSSQSSGGAGADERPDGARSDAQRSSGPEPR